MSAVMLGKMMFAPSSAKALSGRGPVFTAIVKMPAATAARTPSGAFSTTIPSFGFIPALASPMRYGYGSGLPSFTSKLVTTRSRLTSP